MPPSPLLLLVALAASQQCAPHCREACDELNGNVLFECGGCDEQSACWPGATVWPEPKEVCDSGAQFELNSTAASVVLKGGVRMPLVGLGGGLFKGDAEAAVLSSLGLGYRLVDTASNYGTEEAVGRAVRRSGLKRAELFLVSKVVGNRGYAATVESLDRSLAALDVDYLDLFLMHGAAAHDADGLRSERHAVGRLETWRAMNDLQAAGRVRGERRTNDSHPTCGFCACAFATWRLRDAEDRPRSTPFRQPSAYATSALASSSS